MTGNITEYLVISLGKTGEKRIRTGRASRKHIEV